MVRIEIHSRDGGRYLNYLNWYFAIINYSYFYFFVFGFCKQRYIRPMQRKSSNLQQSVRCFLVNLQTIKWSKTGIVHVDTCYTTKNSNHFNNFLILYAAPTTRMLQVLKVKKPLRPWLQLPCILTMLHHVQTPCSFAKETNIENNYGYILTIPPPYI